MWLQDQGILVNLSQALAVLPELDPDALDPSRQKWMLAIIFSDEHAIYLGQWDRLADVEDFIGQLAAELFICGERVKKIPR